MHSERMRTRRDAYILPNEIFLDIVSFASPGTLYNLCLTSKWLNVLAQPFLYRKFEQCSYRDEVSFWPFMRTLIARPDLAA